jgi:hypothetical protein
VDYSGIGNAQLIDSMYFIGGDVNIFHPGQNPAPGSANEGPSRQCREQIPKPMEPRHDNDIGCYVVIYIILKILR